MKKNEKLMREKLPILLKEKGVNFIVKECSNTTESVDQIKKELIECFQELSYDNDKLYYQGIADIVELLEFLFKETNVDFDKLDENIQNLNELYGKYTSNLIEVKKKSKKS
jgi:intracellular sulfur oxidation DsrE/DsrF family protein